MEYFNISLQIISCNFHFGGSYKGVSVSLNCVLPLPITFEGAHSIRAGKVHILNIPRQCNGLT